MSRSTTPISPHECRVPIQSRVTLATLRKYKRQGEKFACLTAYDASFAALLERAGVDVILVGDTLGMVIQGHGTTLPVTVADMIYHTRCVARGSRRPLLMVDMPFMSYATPLQAVGNAARLMQEGGAHMVKLEGGSGQADLVDALSAHAFRCAPTLACSPSRYTSWAATGCRAASMPMRR